MVHSESGMSYDLELERVKKIIKREKPKKLCIQFADGLKQFSGKVHDVLKSEFPECDIFIWGGTCFGACDTPIVLKNYNFDLVIQFGHSEWK